MNFTQVVNEVMSIVKRPDKLLDVRREVNSAVNQFCMDVQPGFSFDIVEVNQALVPNQMTQALALSLFPRFRKIQYIKYGGSRKFLTALPRKELLNSSCDFRDKYYIAGTNLNISLATTASALDIGYFAAPPLLDDVTINTHWMLDLSPYMVIDRAAAKIFNDIGDNDSSNRREAAARAAFLIAQKDYGITTQ
jgi:hypothetical protein